MRMKIYRFRSCLNILLEKVLGAKKAPSTFGRKRFTSGTEAIDSIEAMTTKVIKREGR